MANRKKFRENTGNIVVLTVQELDDLVYSAAYRAANTATSSLYKGLNNAYLKQFDDDFRTIIDEMEQIRLRLDNQGDSEDVAADEQEN